MGGGVGPFTVCVTGPAVSVGSTFLFVQLSCQFAVLVMTVLSATSLFTVTSKLTVTLPPFSGTVRSRHSTQGLPVVDMVLL